MHAVIDSQPPSLTSAVERVLASSQRVLVDRLDLLLLEVREDVATAVRGGAVALGGAILLFYGWIVLVAWVVYMLWGSLPLGAAGQSSGGSECTSSVASG